MDAVKADEFDPSAWEEAPCRSAAAGSVAPGVSGSGPPDGGTRRGGGTKTPGPGTVRGMEYRTEHDSMGEVRVPATAKWGAQTQRAVENFPISGRPIERAHIEALGRIKAAAAKVNAELGVIDADMAEAIREAAAEVVAGDRDGEFPIDVFQTGSGTSSNMNANEVIATLAAERLGRKVHPNDHVNASQSSNDVFPSSIHIAATSAVVRDLVPALTRLAEALEAKAAEFSEVVKAGRTHLMDATPVTLGQEFGGYAAQVRYGIERVESALPRLAELPLGGTAVGTGINTPAGLRRRGDRGADDHHRPAADGGTRPLRGAGRAGRGRGDVGAAADRRGRPDQDRERPALDVVRTRVRVWPRSACRTSSRGRRSCRAR